ncbi:MAG: LD-carboxypeptidase [Pedobacter sp.]|nr:MAG: LD-carboxypeptidase [Pedobacter sp.]
MKRKIFLSLFSGATLATAIPFTLKAEDVAVGPKKRIPAYLKPGDTIGITCPAGYITEAEIAPAVLQMETWGLQVKIGKTVGMRDFTFGGTDDQRQADFQAMIDDSTVNAIMCARGGYGFVRILDQIDFTNLKHQPKWIIGFSDITILHVHLQKNLGLASIHSKMCNSFPNNWEMADDTQKDTILSIKRALFGEAMTYHSPANIFNRFGNVKGELVGGNLRCIENLAGSISEIDTDGKILFLEDTGEALYSIDRMFYNLLRSDKLKNLKGLIIGGFKLPNSEDPTAFGRSLEQIVLEKLKGLSYPVAFDFPVGHQRLNYALKCGIKHQFQVNETGAYLNEV